MAQRFTTSCMMVAGLVALGGLVPQQSDARRRLVPDRPSIEVRLEALRDLRRSTQLSTRTQQQPSAVPFHQGPSVPARNVPVQVAQKQRPTPPKTVAQRASQALTQKPTPQVAPTYVPSTPVRNQPAPSVQVVQPAPVLPVPALPKTVVTAKPVPTPVVEPAPVVIVQDEVDVVPTLDISLDEIDMTPVKTPDIEMPELPAVEMAMPELPELPDMPEIAVAPPQEPTPAIAKTEELLELPAPDLGELASLKPIEEIEQPSLQLDALNPPLENAPEFPELPPIEEPAVALDDIAPLPDMIELPELATPGDEEDVTQLTQEVDALLDNPLPDDFPQNDETIDVALSDDVVTMQDMDIESIAPPKLIDEVANDVDTDTAIVDDVVNVPPMAVIPPAKKEVGFFDSVTAKVGALFSDDESPLANDDVPPPPVMDSNPVEALAIADIDQADPAALPPLPAFKESETEVVNALPPLPAFNNDTQSVQETAPAALPPLPFGDVAEDEFAELPPLPFDSDANAVSSDEDQQFAALDALPSEPLASLDDLDGGSAGNVALSVFFSQSEVEVPLAFQQPLINLSKDLMADKNNTIEVVSYASGTQDQASIARRTSLARALAVRGFLIDLGIDNTRISVKPEGNNIADGPSERADIVIISE